MIREEIANAVPKNGQNIVILTGAGDIRNLGTQIANRGKANWFHEIVNIFI